jgi:hypothetical protein
MISDANRICLQRKRTNQEMFFTSLCLMIYDNFKYIFITRPKYVIIYTKSREQKMIANVSALHFPIKKEKVMAL